MTAYFKLLAERVLLAFAASLAAILTAGGFDLLNAPWEQSLATAGMAALLALLGSVAGGAVTSSNSPAITSKETELEVERPSL
jgi:4-amino-4-deoxy-L-arabinose transferase-like glycosyltransferase